MSYKIEYREMPEAFKRKGGWFTPARTQWERPWIITRDGKQIGAYKTREQAERALPK